MFRRNSTAPPLDESTLKIVRLQKLVGCITVAGALLLCAGFFRGFLHSNAKENELVTIFNNSIKTAERHPERVGVGLFCFNGDDETVHQLHQTLSSFGFTCRLVSAADIQAGALNNLDVIVFPGGSGHKQAEAIGESGRRLVRNFVNRGGGYVGICGGAFLATENYDWSLGLVNAKTMTGERMLPGLGIVHMAARPEAIVQIELTSPGKTIFSHSQGLLDVQFSGGPILSPARRDDLPDYLTLAVFRTEVLDNELQRNTMIGTPAVIASRFGNGRVMLFSPHPEMTKGLEEMVIMAVGSVSGFSAMDHGLKAEGSKESIL